VITFKNQRVVSMWLNEKQTSNSAIEALRTSLLSTCPQHVVIDNLFDAAKLDEVVKVLQQSQHWQTQQHTYSALYVNSAQWQQTSLEERFVQRDVWRRETPSSNTESTDTDCPAPNIAHEFLSFLRGDTFMNLLSHIFKVTLTDKHVSDPAINTNYFRLGAADFVEQHADDSPGREVCMLLYLNKEWNHNAGGELVFRGQDNKPISIAPLYNRCVLFDPFSEGSEHWVKRLKAPYADGVGGYRYNVTSWYWSA